MLRQKALFLQKAGYGYTVAFANLVTNNIAITPTGSQKLNVNKAAIELTFPVTSYKYGRTKVSIENDLLNKFIDGNNDLFSLYACFWQIICLICLQ